MTPMMGDDDAEVAIFDECNSLGNRSDTRRGKLWSIRDSLCAAAGRMSSRRVKRAASGITEVAVGVAIPTVG
jgi:hypothetical protein